MSTLTEIEAALPKLSAEELAELERRVRVQRRKQQRSVAQRAPRIKGALTLTRRSLDAWQTTLEKRNWRG